MDLATFARVLLFVRSRRVSYCARLKETIPNVRWCSCSLDLPACCSNSARICSSSSGKRPPGCGPGGMPRCALYMLRRYRGPSGVWYHAAMRWLSVRTDIPLAQTPPRSGRRQASTVGLQGSRDRDNRQPRPASARVTSQLFSSGGCGVGCRRCLSWFQISQCAHAAAKAGEKEG